MTSKCLRAKAFHGVKSKEPGSHVSRRGKKASDLGYQIKDFNVTAHNVRCVWAPINAEHFVLMTRICAVENEWSEFPYEVVRSPPHLNMGAVRNSNESGRGN